MYSKSLCFVGGACISGTTHSRKLKFSVQTYLIHISIIIEYCHASVILDNADVLHLEDGNVCRPVLKNNTATMFFLKKSFLVKKCCHSYQNFDRQYLRNGDR